MSTYNWDEMDWQPAETAPFGQRIWVRNDFMDNPIVATRGYVNPDGAVNGNDLLFTSVYDPAKFMPLPAGKMVCPKEWAPYEEESQGDAA